MMRSSAADEGGLCLPPKPLVRLPSRPLPAGTVDTHFHVFAAGAPLATPRNYTPWMMTLDDWLGFAAALSVDRGVVVQPSVYGRDNDVLLAALGACPDRLRGVAVVDPGASDSEFNRLDAAGVRGVRINTRNVGGLSIDRVEEIGRRIAPLGWHIQLQVDSSSLEALDWVVARCPVPIVIDHLGLIPVGDRSARDPRLADLLDVLKTGRCYVKLSAPYRLTRTESYRGVDAVVAAILNVRPDRLIWGSDWPHTELWRAMPDDANLVDLTQVWLGNDENRRLVFVENAARIYWDH